MGSHTRLSRSAWSGSVLFFLVPSWQSSSLTTPMHSAVHTEIPLALAWEGEGFCTSHNGHTCNIFCCNCGGGRPGTSKCLPGTGRKRRSVHGYGVAPWETVEEMDEEMDKYY